MLINVKKLKGYKILATDEEIGQVDDFFIDGEDWVLRYLVVDTGPWILGRKVLLTNHALQNIDWDSEVIAVNLTRDQVKNSPDIDTAEMISRPKEKSLYQHYGWPVYWDIPSGSQQAGLGPTPPVMPPQDAGSNPEFEDDVLETEEPFLHRFSEVKGYKVVANDGDLGHMDDFVIEATDWAISYFIVNTGGWFHKGNYVMLAPHWITRIDSDENKVLVDLKKETIRSSPEFEPEDILEKQ